MTGIEIASLVFSLGKSLWEIGQDIAKAVAEGREEALLEQLEALLDSGKPRVRAAIERIRATKDAINRGIAERQHDETA